MNETYCDHERCTECNAVCPHIKSGAIVIRAITVLGIIWFVTAPALTIPSAIALWILLLIL